MANPLTTTARVGGTLYAHPYPKLEFAWAELLPGLDVRVPFPEEKWLETGFGPEWHLPPRGEWHWVFSKKNFHEVRLPPRWLAVKLVPPLTRCRGGFAAVWL